MAFGGESDVQLRPELSANRTPIDFGVEQNAVAQLSDAFRKGLVNADDIISRYGDLAQSTQKAQIQGLDEFISPEAIENRKLQSSLLGEKTKQQISMLPLEEQTTRAKLESEKIAAQQGDTAAMRKFAAAHGFAGLLSSTPPGGNYTPEQAKQDAQVFSDAAKYQSATTSAENIGKDINRIPHSLETSEGGVTTVTKDPNKDLLASKTSQINYSPEEAKKAKVLADMTPQEWVDAGRPTVGEFVFGVKPSAQKPGAAAPAVVPVTALKTPAKTVHTKTVNPDGTVVEKTETIEATDHPASEAIAASTPAEPADISQYVTKRVNEKVKAPTTEDREKLFGQIRTVDEMSNKINSAQAIVHNEAIKPVGPGMTQGTQLGQTLAKVGAAFGNETAVKKAEAQNQLDQFIAQSIQGTIRSMAGSGNRVMQAEIDPHTGLFTRANPGMSSTPATWDKWFGEMRDLFTRARADALSVLPEEDRKSIPPAVAPVVPSTEKPSGVKATPVSTGNKLAFINGEWKYVK